MKKALIVLFVIFGFLLMGVGFAQLDRNAWCEGVSKMGSSAGRFSDPYQWHTTGPYTGHMGGPYLGYTAGSYPVYRYTNHMGGSSPTRMAARYEGKFRTLRCPAGMQ